MNRKTVCSLLYLHYNKLHIYPVCSFEHNTENTLKIYLPEDKNKFIVDWAFPCLMKRPEKIKMKEGKNEKKFDHPIVSMCLCFKLCL